tara:strand:+ start:703 stop:1143 length:441 start_codon:yes stop_codon:yes gene_type:complete
MGTHIKSFATFTETLTQMKAVREKEEMTKKQKEYSEFFMSLLQKYGASSPADLSDEKKKEFFDEINKGWSGKVTSTGEKSLNESESVVTEAEVTSDEEFKEYAETVLKKMHGEDYDEAKAQEVIDGLLSKKKDNDYGSIVGMLNKG